MLLWRPLVVLVAIRLPIVIWWRSIVLLILVIRRLVVLRRPLVGLLWRLGLDVVLLRQLALFIPWTCNILTELTLTNVIVLSPGKLLLLPPQLLLGLLGCPLQLQVALSQVLVHLFNLFVHLPTILHGLIVLLFNKVHGSF